MIWPDIAFASYYALEFLYDLLKRRKEKDIALLKLLEEVEAAYQSYAHRLAKAIFDYFSLASFGEARHAEQWLIEGWMLDCFPPKCSREKAYEIAKKYDPQEFLPLLFKVFQGDWDLGFGGEVWLEIVALALRRKELGDLLFVDRAIQLQHWQGSCFDKGVIFHDGSSYLDDVLRSINDDTPEEWLAENFVNPLAKRLLTKAKRLGIKGIPEIRSDEEGSYEKIVWGKGCPKLLWKGGYDE